MSRSIHIVLAASLGAGCGDYGYYGFEMGAPVYDETTPVHDELYYRDMYGWYYPYGGWIYAPAPAPRQREERQQRAPQAPLPPPPEEPTPKADDDVDRDPK